MAWKLAGIVAVLAVGAASAEVDRAALSKLLAEHRGKQWDVSRKVDDMTGIENVILAVKANNYIEGVIGQRTIPTLIVACFQNKTTVAITADGVFWGSDTGRVLVKLDDGAATPETWRLDKETTGATAPIPLARRLVKAEVVKFRVPMYDEAPADMSFTVAGLEKHIGQVQSACGWK